jgi:3-hydroxybutyryl-CoA dehydratase
LINEGAIADISELSIGQACTSTVLIGEKELSAFMALTGDNAPLHVDHEAAMRKGFEGRVAHGMLVGSFYSTILGCYLPGPNTVISKISLDMLKPVYEGDLLTYCVAVERLSEAVRSVRLALSATNQRDEIVSKGTAICVFKQ